MTQIHLTSTFYILHIVDINIYFYISVFFYSIRTLKMDNLSALELFNIHMFA